MARMSDDPTPRQARPIGDLLTAGGTALALLRRARLLEQVQDLVRRELEPATAPAVRVANIRDGVLVLYASHAAAATRVRFASRKLLEQLRAQMRIDVWSLEVVTLPPTELHRIAEGAQAGAGRAPG